MFAYCGNNPVNREDNGGEFWHIVTGALVGAAMGAAAEAADQLINYFVFGEELDPGEFLIGALQGAVYGGVMAATGSHTAASLTSTATESIALGIYHGDSVEQIVSDTIVSTLTETVKCVAPRVINKSLSGKYLKLGKVGEVIKQYTDPSYVGRYASNKNYLPDAFESSILGFGNDLGLSAYQTGMRILIS